MHQCEGKDKNFLRNNNTSPGTRKLYIETYGCQMNVSDSEVVVAILSGHQYEITDDIRDADIILVNTCSIRENAEKRIFGRISVFKQYKNDNPQLIIGIIGCMAERLKDVLFNDKAVDLVAGPDAYRDIPVLLENARKGEKGINVALSLEETYDDIEPVRIDKKGVSAFIAIMRGCNNFCSYCVVPYTRGRERSRDPETIILEARELINKGYKEVTLLGQNVNSYHWEQNGKCLCFSDLLDKVAEINPLLRVRFATSHPKDLSDELLHVMAKHPNICRHIHLPCQSGSSSVLKIMNRKYTRDDYLQRVAAINQFLPGCSITTDIISGFCTETEEDHQQTLSLMENVGFDFAYMFKYSERPGTTAIKRYKDDVPDDVKTRRLNEIIELQKKLSAASNQKDVGKTFEVLVEGPSKRSPDDYCGRTSQNKMVVFPKKKLKPGIYTRIKIIDYTSATLIGV
jgi:tRNA-2-methylthio-N6-dimethylallyladenosine synthase